VKQPEPLDEWEQKLLGKKSTSTSFDFCVEAKQCDIEKRCQKLG